MRKVLLFLFFAFQVGKAQLIYETTYTGAPWPFILTQISQNEYKYFVFNDVTNQIHLYNLNHSLFLTTTVPVIFSNNNYAVNFVSRSLFDCDTSNIEYAIAYSGGSPSFPAPYFAIFRINGTLFQKIDSVRFINYSNGLAYATYNNAVPIINTPLGTKLILSKPNNNIVVYSLCGTLPNECANEIVTDIEDFSPRDKHVQKLPYPNPMEETIHLPYDIPNNGKPGKMKVYNSMGQLVKEFEIDGNFKNIILFKGDLPSGTYIYNTIHDGELSASLKFVLTD
ncbi:MAG: T9SS type A sorting domain-containing protein [Bacteroidia bacterium]|jgi:hypothetical protein|nr:T9SS type A sorting domain-containing protein [Bacteroidia bacterium]